MNKILLSFLLLSFFSCKRCIECKVQQVNQTQDTTTFRDLEFCGSKKDVDFYKDSQETSSGTFYENGDTIVKTASCISKK